MRIFLAESDPELRVGLQFLIYQQPSYQVIGITDNGNGLPSQIKASQPDVLLLDWYLPGKPMNELIADVQVLDLPLNIIAMSIFPEDEGEARASGVDYFISKATPPSDLIDLLKTVKSKTANDGQVSSKEENL